MPIGHAIPKEIKAQIVTALMTQLDKSIPKIAKKFALHEWTLYQIAKQFNIRRPRGSAALSHRKHKQNQHLTSRVNGAGRRKTANEHNGDRIGARKRGPKPKSPSARSD
jgi:hypothetical protein